MKTLIESFVILKKFNIADTRIIERVAELGEIEFPYYMKVSISGHKTESKGIFRCKNLGEAEVAFATLKKKFPGEKIIIQEEIIGLEMVIGLKRDPVFGKLLMIGFGGTNLEVLKDIQFLATPVSKIEIKKAVNNLKQFDCLCKRKNYAIDKFVDLAYEVSKLDIKELDLNPVILTEKKAIIVDARLED
jgi:hypothetical protein